jgi:UDP-3-O-[3-hydroxymyristoyl] glucosamine N-acyltransferase
MFRGVIRILVSASLIWIGPASLIAADAGAVLYGKGVVLRNNTEIGTSAAIFPGDLIETKSDSTGNLNSLGTSVIILPNSLVEFEGQSLSVEHGSVSVSVA